MPGTTSGGFGGAQPMNPGKFQGAMGSLQMMEKGGVVKPKRKK
jgi:putative effector of murein hydrolase